GTHTITAKDGSSDLASAQFTVTVPSSTNPVSIRVNAIDLSRNQITGLWTALRDTTGTTLAQGFTPTSFTVTSGSTYVVHVGNYQNFVFDHWSNGGTTSYYTITPTQSATLTAYYSTGSTTRAPQPPTGLTATVASSSQINLSWIAPSNNGGSTITGYKIERSTNSGTWSTILSNTGSVSTTYSNSGLNPGTSYTCRVSAINVVG